jgi:hypothetical protein
LCAPAAANACAVALAFHSAQGREIVRLPEKAATKRELGPFASQCIDKSGNVRDAVLAVRIESNQHFGTLCQGVLEPGLQGGALA